MKIHLYNIYAIKLKELQSIEEIEPPYRSIVQYIDIHLAIATDEIIRFMQRYKDPYFPNSRFHHIVAERKFFSILQAGLRPK